MRENKKKQNQTRDSNLKFIVKMNDTAIRERKKENDDDKAKLLHIVDCCDAC